MGPKNAMRAGAYVLVIQLKERKSISVGRLGRFTFEAGTYAYVGSAMNGLDARVARHKRREKKLHWHVDYLLNHAKVVDVLEFESDERQECEINAQVHKDWSGTLPVSGFGASDCCCKSHLHLLPPGAKTDTLRP